MDVRAEILDAAIGILPGDLDELTAADCRCNGTGHDVVGDPCDGPKGDGCCTDPRNLADANALAEVR